VEWIGEIPEGWEVKKFRFLFNFSKGLNITKENLQEEGIPCVNYGEIHSKYSFELDPEKHPVKCVSEEYLETAQKSLLRKGDFIFADTSEDVEAAGSFTYLKSEVPTFAGYHTIITRLKKPMVNRFIAYFLNSDAFRNQVRQKVKGVKVYSITNAILKETLICLPQLEEQQGIVKYLDIETKKIDQVISFQQKQIEKLKEYKATLIDSVVTGKILVKGESDAY
ncbi:MAG: restriction endonuclease subunit S, partial [Sulfurovum sp.]|nr:restriction endonuclease subunit S [Sulfurovum sp.]